MDNYEPQERQHLRELKWKELMSRVDAYRFYIKLILELNAFYYATTGAVLLYYLAYALKQPDNYLEFFLLLPIIMGTVIGGFLRYATALQRHNSKIIDEIRAELTIYGMQIQDIPDLRLLNRLLQVFGNIFFMVAVSLCGAVPLLTGINSWSYMTVWPKIGLAAFALIGFHIVNKGWKCSKSMIHAYDDKRTCDYERKRLSSLATNSHGGETKDEKA